MASKTLLLAAFALPVAAHAQILNDTFSDGDRLNQNLPTSSAWYLGPSNSTTPGTFTVTDGQLQYRSGANTTAMWGMTYFTDSGSVNLADGQTLQISFDLTLTQVRADDNNGIQFAILNSGGSRISGDLTATSDATFSAYTGYKLVVNPSVNQVGVGTTSTARSGMFERTSTNNHPFAATAYTVLGSYQTEADWGGSNFIATANTPLSVTLSLARSGGELTFTATLGNWTASRTDTTGTFSFDTFSLLTSTATFTNGNGFNIDNFNVSVIPEPSSAAALVGVFALGAVALRRRRK